MQISLRELFNTRYMYITMCKDFNYMMFAIESLMENPEASVNVFMKSLVPIFEAAKRKEEIAFDLKQCRCTPDFNNAIESWIYKGYTFVDSEDVYRNKVLKEIERRSKLVKEGKVPLPHFTVRDDLTVYLNSLSRDVEYIVTQSDPKLMVPLLVLVLALRPTVSVDCSMYLTQIIQFVAARMSKSCYDKYEAFYVVTPEGVMNMHVDDLFKQDVGKISLETALENFTMVPTAFGSKRIRDNADFSTVIDMASNMLMEAQANVPAKLTTILEGNKNE